MAAPKKPGMSWLDFAFGVASRAAKQTANRLRTEYVAGREGKPDPQPMKRPAPQPHSKGPAWWEVLGLPRVATLADVTAAYRALIQKNHPDKVAQLSAPIRRVAEEETRRINAAYAEAQRLLGGAGRR